jgi:hypothetical protein
MRSAALQREIDEDRIARLAEVSFLRFVHGLGRHHA